MTVYESSPAGLLFYFHLALKKTQKLTLSKMPEKAYNKTITEKKVPDMEHKKLRSLIFAALLAALTTVATMVIRIPTPTLGYIHLGDGLVLACGILLGPGLGALAAGIGSMLADLFGGYMAWVPGTFAIKALTALVGGWLYHRLTKHEHWNTPMRVVLCGIPAEIVMVAGYFLYEVGMETVAGSTVGAAAAAVLAGVPFNMVQGLAGVIVCAVLLPVLSHASTEMGERMRV